jgi:hypothetical protein
METGEGTNSNSNIWCLDHDHSKAAQEDKAGSIKNKINIGWIL